jgi:hypothetical protein
MAPENPAIAAAIAYRVGFIFMVLVTHQRLRKNTPALVIPLLLAWLLAATHETIARIAIVWLTTAPIAAFGLRRGKA